MRFAHLRRTSQQIAARFEYVGVHRAAEPRELHLNGGSRWNHGLATGADPRVELRRNAPLIDRKLDRRVAFPKQASLVRSALESLPRLMFVGRLGRVLCRASAGGECSPEDDEQRK